MSISVYGIKDDCICLHIVIICLWKCLSVFPHPRTLKELQKKLTVLKEKNIKLKKKKGFEADRY